MDLHLPIVQLATVALSGVSAIIKLTGFGLVPAVLDGLLAGAVLTHALAVAMLCWPVGLHPIEPDVDLSDLRMDRSQLSCHFVHDA